MKNFENINPTILLNAAKLYVNSFAKKRFPGFFAQYELDEIASDVIYNVLRSNTYDPAKGDFHAWLRRSAANAVLTAAKKKGAHNSLFVSYEDVSPASDEDQCGSLDHIAELGYGSEMPDEILIAKETQENISCQFKGRAHKILELRCEGYSSGEIADKLGITPGATYMAVHHIMEKVKKVA